ncbi:hypothetical protein Tco_0532096 [Tanacetum coccineum]
MVHDYGPVPFRFFHHWIHLEGFNDFVTSTWNSAPSVDSNEMRNLAGKLKFLKAHIKIWIKDNKSETVSTIANLKKELNQLDAVIDKGTGTEVEAEKRMEVLAALRNIDHIHSMDLAQKAKIKWSIEGDENSNFFHGILNKKRNQMNIRGITIDGVWKEQPNDVKQEFLSHFQDRFAKPSERPNPPGPDFSFGFRKAFLAVIEHDVYIAVIILNHGEIPPGWMKQGDPLSPFLFILVMEEPSFIFSKNLNAGCLKSGVTVIQASASFRMSVLKVDPLATILGQRVGGSMTRAQAWQETGSIPVFTCLLSKFLQRLLSYLKSLLEVISFMPMYTRLNPQRMLLFSPKIVRHEFGLLHPSRFLEGGIDAKSIRQLVELVSSVTSGAISTDGIGI